MTTIAYKDGLIAWDSQITAGAMVVSRNYQKMHKANGITLWCAGSVQDREHLVKALSSGRFDWDMDLEIEAIVLDKTGLYLVSVRDGRVWRDTIPPGEAAAIGSGADYAMGAMDAGCDAVQAVKIAAGRDVSTGGKVRSKRIG
jgi:ATP-dependent protease HslVU (ClpYQ) peptidase subunit